MNDRQADRQTDRQALTGCLATTYGQRAKVVYGNRPAGLRPARRGGRKLINATTTNNKNGTQTKGDWLAGTESRNKCGRVLGSVCVCVYSVCIGEDR